MASSCTPQRQTNQPKTHEDFPINKILNPTFKTSPQFTRHTRYLFTCLVWLKLYQTMRKLRRVPNKWEVQEELQKETKNEQVCSTGEKGISRHGLRELKGNPYSGPLSSPKQDLCQTQPLAPFLAHTNRAWSTMSSQD